MRISDWSSDVCSSDLRLPGLQQHLFRLLSRSIGRAALLAGDFSADERMAAFLIGMSERLAARGFSPNRFALTMPRTDIANYLRLAPETVSRVLKRFQEDGLLQRSEEHTSELQSLMRISYAVFCLKKKK